MDRRHLKNQPSKPNNSPRQPNFAIGSLKYYFADDIAGYVGHRYLGGLNALALGAEFARPLSPGVLGSAFVEGRVGENNASGIWGGLKLYFGPNDKPLIARHRVEDPPNWNVDNLFGILGNHATSTSTSRNCRFGVNFKNKGNCENPGLRSLVPPPTPYTASLRNPGTASRSTR